MFYKRYNLPSIKTLATIAGDRAKELRTVLEITKRSELETVIKSGKYPATAKWYFSSYNPLLFHTLQTAKLSICDEVIGTSGVEYIRAGRNAKSPAIEFCNSGDMYTSTLMYISGRGYKVGCWGDIVERGNYE